MELISLYNFESYLLRYLYLMPEYFIKTLKVKIYLLGGAVELERVVLTVALLGFRREKELYKVNFILPFFFLTTFSKLVVKPVCLLQFGNFFEKYGMKKKTFSNTKRLVLLYKDLIFANSLICLELLNQSINKLKDVLYNLIIYRKLVNC